MRLLKKHIRQFITAGIVLTAFICLSCCFYKPAGYITAVDAPEIDVDVAWQIPDDSGGLNSLFDGKYMYYVSSSEKEILIIDLENEEVINTLNITSSTNPVRNGEYIYFTNKYHIDGNPILYFTDAEGSFIGEIPLAPEYNGWYFDLFSHGNFIYWRPFVDGKQSFVRLDTSTINHVSGNEYTADVQVLYGPVKDFMGAYPTFYGGKVYKSVDDYHYKKPTRVLIFDEESGSLDNELVLSESVGANNSVEVFISGNIGLVHDARVDMRTGDVLERNIRVSTHFAPYTFVDNYGYSSSSSHGGTEFTSLWKLNMETLEVEWYYQHDYSLGSQPQVANGIVYVTAPDMILLVDADNGNILAKDTDLKGHPVQQSNSYLYKGQMIFHDGYNITAIKTNWKKTSSGGVEKVR